MSTDDRLSTNDVYVVQCRSQMIEINNFCRSQEPAIGFIAMDGFGLCASVFVDFGDEFVIFDSDGEALKSSIIEGITQVRGLGSCFSILN